MLASRLRVGLATCSVVLATTGIAYEYGALKPKNALVHADAKLPRLLSAEEVKSSFTELTGENKNTKYDVSELPSLGEDATCHGFVDGYECWGIFDGHSGWCCSNYVSQNLLSYIQKSFDDKRKKKWLQIFTNGKIELSNEDTDKAISNGFTTLDNSIISAPLNALKANDPNLAAASLPIALNGSCAMLAMYEPIKKILKVALVGDSRAVLGQQDSSGTWHAKNLTFDQTGATESEIKRIRSEHPLDPPSIVSRGRVLGYQPSRTFGDAVTKWSNEDQSKLNELFWINRHHPLLKSPPYLTARPEITTTSLDVNKPTFLVLGCDGLFEWLTNKQVVELVGEYLQKEQIIPCAKANGSVNVQDNSNDNSAKDYMRPKSLGWPALQHTVEDTNTGTHLIRNALGGADFTKVSLLLSIPSPLSRRHRDDITCTVIYFKPTN